MKIKFTSHRKEVEAALENALNVGMEAVAKEAEGNAMREVTTLVYDTPPSASYVRTGALRNSISAEYAKGEKAVYVGSNIEYAPYVEFGTRHMHERPFIKNSIRNYVDAYKAILEDALKSLS